MRAVPAQPRRARTGRRRTAPATASAAARPGSSSTVTVDVVQPGQPGELLADDGGLELAAARPVRRAASRTRRTGPGRCTGRAARPGPASLEHLDGVGAAEAGVAVLGHPDDDPLAGQRVPDEHDPALVPRDAVPAVRDRARR